MRALGQDELSYKGWSSRSSKCDRPVDGARRGDRAVVGLAPIQSGQVLVDGGDLHYARLTTDDSRVLLFTGGTTFSMFGPFGGVQSTLRGSGGAPLSADAKR